MIMKLHFSQRQIDDAMETFAVARRAILWSVGEHHPLYATLFAVVADMYYESFEDVLGGGVLAGGLKLI